MEKKHSNNDFIAFVVGHEGTTHSTESSKLKRHHFHLQQDFNRAEITGKLDKPILLLFGAEKVDTYPFHSELCEVHFKNGPRIWKWAEKRIFNTQKELISSLQHPNFSIEKSKLDEEKGKLITTGSALKNRLDRGLANNPESGLVQTLFHLIFEYFTGKGNQCLDELKSLINENNVEASLKAIALNILADYYTSRNQLNKAVEAAERSIELQKNQIAAYLLCSNAFKLLGQKMESFTQINSMPEIHNSDLILDIHLEKTDSLLLKLEASDQINNNEYSYEVASDLFGLIIEQDIQINNLDLLDRLIIDSIKYEKLPQARKFLSQRLEQGLKEDKPANAWYKIDELMSFFLEKKDFEFAIAIYSKFLELGIQPALSRRRMVALLIKTNRLNKARELSIDSKAFFT